MAHQFSALHGASFVAVSHTTRERLRQVNITALGLITEMTAHVDGFPVTLDTIIKRTKKPGATALREAYQDLIDERLLVYIRYTLQIPGQRPYQSSTTVIAREAITDNEFAEHIIGKYTPGQLILDRQPDDEVRKVKVLSATVRHWDGEKKITKDGALGAPEPKKKPGPKKGTRSGQQPKKGTATDTIEELGTPGSSMSRENGSQPKDIEELGTPGSSMSRENSPSAQGNEELGDEDSSSPSSLTRPGDKTTNQTTAPDAAAPPEPGVGTRKTGWLDRSAEEKEEGQGRSPDSAPKSDSAGATLLRSLGVTGRAVSSWAATVDTALNQLGEQQTRHTLEYGLETAERPAGVIVKTRLPDLHGKLAARQESRASTRPRGNPRWCGDCEPVKHDGRPTCRPGCDHAVRADTEDVADAEASITADEATSFMSRLMNVN